MSDRVTVLLAAGGEQWEAGALGMLSGGSSHVLKRCVDLTDLLASATTGQVDVAVVAGELPGLDADAIMMAGPDAGPPVGLDDDDAFAEPLTTRETQVLELLAEVAHQAVHALAGEQLRSVAAAASRRDEEQPRM